MQSKWGKLLSECGRQDSNLHGLSRYPLSARGSLSSGSQGRRVCQFHHARIVRGTCLGFCNVVGSVGASRAASTRPHHPFPTTAATVLLLHNPPSFFVGLHITA